LWSWLGYLNNVCDKLIIYHFIKIVWHVLITTTTLSFFSLPGELRRD